MSAVFEFRYAIRQLQLSPAFTITALVTLALCIGANTAVFSVVDTLFFRPPPYPHPEQLAVIATAARFHGASEIDTSQDGIEWQAVHEHANLLDAAVFGAAAGVNVVARDRVEYVGNERVSAGFFRVLGVMPLLGREFTQNEDVPNGSKVAIISHRLWARAFRADAGITGRTVRLRGEPYTVVGVMPERFLPPSDTIDGEPLAIDVWTPLRATTRGEGSGNNFEVIARLKRGVTFARADAQLQSVLQPIFKERARPGLAMEERALPFQVGATYEIRHGVRLMWGAVAMVLMIGCVNIAGLLLARAAVRRREFATRFALGATRWDVVRQLLSESLLIAAVGGTLGILLGQYLLAALLWLNPGVFELFGPVSLNGRVVAAMLLVSTFTSVAFGLIPALEASRMDFCSALSEGGRTLTTRHGLWMRRGLVFVEVALGVVMVAGAGLLVRTFATLAGANAGFDPEHLMIASASLQDAQYNSAARGDRLFRESLARIRAIPGVVSAAVALTAPYGRPLNVCADEVNGQQPGNCLINFTYATPEMGETLRMKLLRGRFYAEADGASSRPVALANEIFVRRFLAKGVPPIGSTVKVQDKTWQIVGVVQNIQQKNGFGGQWGPVDAFPQLYVPVAQFPDRLFAGVHVWFSPVWMVRTHGDVSGLAVRMRAALADVDPQLPFASVRTMQDLAGRALQSQRYQAVLFSSLAGIALLLAAVGVYGLIAQSVTQRRREMGIRLALGATTAVVVRTAALPGIVLAVSGVGAGLVLAAMLTRLLAGLIWGVKPIDPLTFIGAGLLLVVVATAASLLPAAQLVQIDPAQTLRED